MRNNIIYMVTALMLLMVSCRDANDSVVHSVVFEDDAVSVEGLRNCQVKIDFSTTGNWVASVDSDWITVFPMAGTSSESTVTLIAKSANITGDDRTCKLTIRTDEAEGSINVVQLPTEVLLLEQSEYVISPEGEQLHIRFSSNVSGHKLLYTYTSNVKDWILPVKDANVKALDEFEYILDVLPNPNHNARSAEFYIEIVDPDNYENTYMASEMVTIIQEGLPVDVSEDYSADKTYQLLHQHTIGAGVPIVLMGDGFADKDIESGYYLQVMTKAKDNLFSEEPLKSLSEYVDVWMVNAVSKNNAFGEDWSTCFGCILPDDGSSRIEGNENKTIEYIYAIPELASIEKLSQTLAIVIINSNIYAGTTGFGFSGFGEFGLAYCPVVDALDSERFRCVLVHEAIGHGFAKLYDEYAYENYGNLTTSVYNQVLGLQSEYGWAANVSVVDGYVPWNRLLQDERYSETDAYGEKLGIYEGACTFWTGAWRPTDDSMMRNNQHGFNAPSREAIYKRVMTSALGSQWEYDYEDFVTFDRAHQPAPLTKSSVNEYYPYPLPSPYFAGRPIR